MNAQMPILFKQWQDADEIPIPDDITPIYGVIQYKDGVLIRKVYRMTGKDSHSGIYKKVKWWMPVENMPSLPPGTYAVKDEFYNPGDATKEIKEC